MKYVSFEEYKAVKECEAQGYNVYTYEVEGYRTRYYYDGDNPVVIWTNYEG